MLCVSQFSASQYFLLQAPSKFAIKRLVRSFRRCEQICKKTVGRVQRFRSARGIAASDTNILRVQAWSSMKMIGRRVNASVSASMKAVDTGAAAIGSSGDSMPHQ